MKLKMILTMALVCAASLSALTVGAFAADYGFDGVKAPEYYDSTNYEDVYGAQYNYGGTNAVDYAVPELTYGKSDNTAIGTMEKTHPITSEPLLGGGYVSVDYIEGTGYVPSTGYTAYTPTAFTSVSGMECKDGSIGTVSIPTLGISYKVWEGETTASMSKGLGHYASTSGWDGNVGVCGHNRGSSYVIGAIKDLKIGDTIRYTTVYGTRTYSVTTVATISSTDWSYLAATADNRITLTTCLANQPNYRICVQAVEVA